MSSIVSDRCAGSTPPSACCRSGEAAAGSPSPAHAEVRDFDTQLFRALYAMAIRSPRFQADVHAAMRNASLTAHPARLAAALQRLEVAGRVSNLIPLSDGGLLITVAI